MHIDFHIRRNIVVSGAVLCIFGVGVSGRIPVHIGLSLLSNVTRHDVFVSFIIMLRNLLAKSRLSKIATFSVL